MSDEELENYKEYSIINNAADYLVDKRYFVVVEEKAIRITPMQWEKNTVNLSPYDFALKGYAQRYLGAVTSTSAESNYWTSEDVFLKDGISMSHTLKRESSVRAFSSKKKAEEIAEKVRSYIDHMVRPEHFRIANNELVRLSLVHKEYLEVSVLSYEEFQQFSRRAEPHIMKMELENNGNIPVVITDIYEI